MICESTAMVAALACVFGTEQSPRLKRSSTVMLDHDARLRRVLVGTSYETLGRHCGRTGEMDRGGGAQDNGPFGDRPGILGILSSPARLGIEFGPYGASRRKVAH